MLQWEEEREESGEGKANPVGPSGLPDLIPKAKDTDQDFKQNIIWLPSAEWIAGPAVVAQLQQQHLGHTGSPLVPQGLEHLLQFLQSDSEAASGEQGGEDTSGLPEMKSYSLGLSWPVCAEEQRGCLFTFHIRPKCPA